MEKRLDDKTKKILEKIAATVRQFAIDGTEKANSGHPGLPLGCAELGAYLYGIALQHNPKNPHFLNRDRLVLSAGHGSLWLYTLLHLSGFSLPLEEIKRFRQLHSKTPGHPEYGLTPGVEATTGPLGQGTGNAVGMALGLKILGEKFNTSNHTLFDAKVFCLASDGDIMEGVSSEASSLAGHLNLNNLIFLYDANNVTLDGPLAESCSEDTLTRYRAYGWEVHEIDGYDLDTLHEILSELRTHQTRPVFIRVRTLIGKGSPNKAGTYKVHGSPLGSEEAQATKANLGLSQEEFFTPQAVKSYFEKRVAEGEEKEREWNHIFHRWKEANPQLFEEFEKMRHHQIPSDLEKRLWDLPIKSPIAGRGASQTVLQLLADLLPDLYGGSGDLSHSDLTMLKKFPLIGPGDFAGRNLKFGVREFGMATTASGLALTGMFTPFIGTFLTFSDYMRNAIRLACLSHLHIIYQFTHESIFLGEDGPTHQPIEHYASLRAMPRLQVIRPADANEVKMAWIAALNYKGPTALLLTRQPLKLLTETQVPYKDGLGRGAYIVRKEKKKPDYTLLATGSELSLALDVATELSKRGKEVRVISFPSFELFEAQDNSYKKTLLDGDLGRRVSIEAGVDFGWHKYIGREGIAISIETFGASAPASDLAQPYGFTVDQILERIWA